MTISTTQANGRTELAQAGGIVVGCFQGDARMRAEAEQKVASMLQAGAARNRNLFDIYTAPDSARGCSEVARNTGASAVLSGSVSRPMHNVESEVKQRPNKQTPGRPIREKRITQSSSVVLKVTALNVDNGSILFEHSATGSANHRYTNGKGSASSKDALAAKALDSAVNDIKRQLVPSVKKVSVRFRDDCTTLSGALVAKCQSAVSFLSARPQRLDRACSAFSQIASDAPGNSSMQFNLGLCAEADAATEVACEFYMKVDSLTPGLDSALNLAIERNRCS